MLPRVVITGLGVVSPNGIGKEEFCRAILAGRSGVRRISRFDPTELPFVHRCTGLRVAAHSGGHAADVSSWWGGLGDYAWNYQGIFSAAGIDHFVEPRSGARLAPLLGGSRRIRARRRLLDVRARRV